MTAIFAEWVSGWLVEVESKSGMSGMTFVPVGSYRCVLTLESRASCVLVLMMMRRK